jgi:tetratricopeptide (TPR) repeat protein
LLVNFMDLRSHAAEVLGTETGGSRRGSQQDLSVPQSAEADLQSVAALRAEGRERLKANDFAKAIDLLARAVAAEPRDGPTQLQLGIALQGLRQLAQALTCFVSAQKLMPNDPAPFLHSATAHLELNQPQPALRAASEACHRAPRLSQAHYTYGRALLACNEIAQAERAFAEAVRLMPSWPEAWINYGLVRHRRGAIEDAKGAMERALFHAPGHPEATAHLDAFMRADGAPEGGEEQSMTASEGADAAQTLELGVERYRAGAYAEAEAIFARLCAAPEGAKGTDHQSDPKTLRMLGLARFRLGKLDEALALLEAALKANPADPSAQLHYGLVLDATGRHAEAAALFRSSAKLLPHDPAPHLNLSAALLALGDVTGAVKAATRARRRGPNLPKAHYALGVAHMAADKLDDAARDFAAALRLDAKLADAWVNLGVISYRRNNMQGACEAMRRALAVAPGHIGAAANLGAFLRLSGHVEAAEKLFSEVLERNPEAAQVRVNHAVAMLSENRPQEALALLDEKPAPADPRLAQHWLMQRALALLEVGRTAEAREVVTAVGDVPAEMEPLMLWRRTLLALADNDQETARTHAIAMEQALATTNGLVPEHRIMAHYDLSRFWSAQRDPDRTFANWTAGHRLLGRFQPFSRDAHRAFVDANIATFNAARFSAGPRAQNRDPAPVFIVGMPRTGTTLAEQIISAHPQVFGAGERIALHQLVQRFGGETPEGVARIAALEAAVLDSHAERYLAELRALAPDKTRIVDKMPGNFNCLGLAALMLPGARIIHCVRDPRDVGLSIFTFRFYGHHPYAHDLGDLGWYIAQHDRIMAHWREVLPNPILTLALKDWVEDFDGTLRRVLDFIDLPYDPACERFYESDSRVMTVSRAQVKQPVNANGLGRWRRYATQLQPLIDSLSENGVVLS